MMFNSCKFNLDNTIKFFLLGWYIFGVVYEFPWEYSKGFITVHTLIYGEIFNIMAIIFFANLLFLKVYNKVFLIIAWLMILWLSVYTNIDLTNYTDSIYRTVFFVIIDILTFLQAGLFASEYPCKKTVGDH